MTMLCEQNQVHLMDGWPMPGTDDSEKHKFFTQARHVHEIMHGSCVIFYRDVVVFYSGRSADTPSGIIEFTLAAGVIFTRYVIRMHAVYNTRAITQAAMRGQSYARYI